jgi:hypothetical protein
LPESEQVSAVLSSVTVGGVASRLITTLIGPAEPAALVAEQE